MDNAYADLSDSMRYQLEFDDFLSTWSLYFYEDFTTCRRRYVTDFDSVDLAREICSLLNVEFKFIKNYVTRRHTDEIFDNQRS